MPNITVCARFRPLSSKERRDHGDGVCIRAVGAEAFVLKDEKGEELMFSFDRVFYEESEQNAVFEFLAQPIVRGAVNSINGTIITYGQTGAGKTYSMEGPNILECDLGKKGLLPRVVDDLFKHIKSSEGKTNYSVKLSMVEIYMEKIRDLFDLSKDNIQVKESKTQGILLSGVTEISVVDPSEALKNLSRGIANRAVGETQMNMSSSRSHCVYIFTIHNESVKDKRARTGKLVLVDLAGSEKAEKTAAEGRVLEEAKTINKSLSALGNVIYALTCVSPSKANHIPYRDSKLTRMLQDAIGGNSRSQTALLCCCSPCPSSAPETLSTLRFGMRAKHIKVSPCITEDKSARKTMESSITKDERSARILEKLRERLTTEDVDLLEELFILEGIFFDFDSVEDVDTAYEDVVSKTISSLQQTAEELLLENEELKTEIRDLKAKLSAGKKLGICYIEAQEEQNFVHKVPELLGSFVSWSMPFFKPKMLQ